MATSADAAKEAPLFRPLTGARPGLILGSLVTGAIAGLLFFSWGYQVKNDIGVAGINRPVFWGFYITNFIFWIGISHAGTLISAILRVPSAEWRRPVTRCAEAITVFALSIGGLFPLIHLGRPWLFWFMIPLPNSRGLWPNFRSPLVWDMMAIGTYLTGSVLYLLLPMIPDMAILRDRALAETPASLKARLFRLVALGWRGTTQQWHSLEAGIKVMAVIIIPVAVSVHTIVSWDFSMTLAPMWHSTIFGPYFVVGAIYSGIGVLMLAMYLLRRGLFMPWELADVLEPDMAREGWRALEPLVRLEDCASRIPEPRRKVAALEMAWYMRNQLLRDADWAGMAHSLEIRVPFVDAQLFRSLAPHLGRPGGPDKGAMARTPATPLPGAVLARPKSGFSIPVRDWLHGDAGNGRGERGLRGWARRVYREATGAGITRSAGACT